MSEPLILIIRDGWGIGDPDDPGNAVAAAKTPNVTSYLENYPHIRLGASGEAVGLTPGSQGSSEVGHLNMGAGRIVKQEVVRINNLIEDGLFFKAPQIISVMEKCNKADRALHLMGLVQDQGVHATEAHLYALLELAAQQGLKKVYIHFFTDGRDTPPRSALTYLERLEEKISALGTGRIASVMGRYYAMDRDRNWERTAQAYHALTLGKGRRAASAREAIEAAYARADALLEKNGTTQLVENDEFITPTLITNEDKEVFGTINPEDSVIFFNYRQDRAIQLTMAFVEDGFTDFERGPKLETNYLGFTRYYDAFKQALLPPMNMLNILGEILAQRGAWQLRISETQKFRHVTSFFNSKLEQPFPFEDRILIDSPKVPEDTKPEMSAYEITEVVLEAIEGGILRARATASNRDHVTCYEAQDPSSEPIGTEATYQVIILNFVNGDMVGHTGNFQATVKAIEAVDDCVGQVVRAILKRDGIALLTADHGNAEQMRDPMTGKVQTAHTLNDVEFIFVSNKSEDIQLKPRGILSDIAPTILQLLNIPQPPEMTAASLLA